jgi:hypothetical protein
MERQNGHIAHRKKVAASGTELQEAARNQRVESFRKKVAASVTRCVRGTFNFDNACISKNTFKKPLTKPSLDEPDRWQLELFCPAGKD